MGKFTINFLLWLMFASLLLHLSVWTSADAQTRTLSFTEKLAKIETDSSFSISEHNSFKVSDASADLEAMLIKNKYRLEFSSGKLEAEGAEFLAREAAASQFFLIGEIHGIAEIPQFTQALFHRISDSGYRNLAVETGLITARILEDLAGKRNARQLFVEFDRQNPFALPFYNTSEEASLIETILNADDKRKSRIWGLDHEFILSSKMHFKRLVELAPNKEAKKLVGEYYERVSTEFERMTESRNPGVLFIISATKEDFKKLQAALRPKIGSETAEILQSLKIAHEIYLKKFVFGQNYESNLQRTQLMKKQFMRYYKTAQQQEKLPKVMLKFGAIHTKRGRSYENLYDIGALTTELASMNGTQSFHLLILPLTGTINTYRPFAGNEADKIKKYETELFLPDDSVDFKPFLSLAKNENRPFVVDLRPFRSQLDAKRLVVDKGLSEIIWGYDAVLVMPQVRASNLLN